MNLPSYNMPDKLLHSQQPVKAWYFWATESGTMPTTPTTQFNTFHDALPDLIRGWPQQRWNKLRLAWYLSSNKPVMQLEKHTSGRWVCLEPEPGPLTKLMQQRFERHSSLIPPRAN